jgi:electron transfer flavoprotein beta subunit
MKIAVLVKEVPDTWGDRRIDPTTKRVDRSADEVVDEVNEKAVEIALQVQAANPGSEVTIVTMGPKGAIGGLRKSLAMGADNAIHRRTHGRRPRDARRATERRATDQSAQSYRLGNGRQR